VWRCGGGPSRGEALRPGRPLGPPPWVAAAPRAVLRSAGPGRVSAPTWLRAARAAAPKQCGGRRGRADPGGSAAPSAPPPAPPPRPPQPRRPRRARDTPPEGASPRWDRDLRTCLPPPRPRRGAAHPGARPATRSSEGTQGTCPHGSAALTERPPRATELLEALRAETTSTSPVSVERGQAIYPPLRPQRCRMTRELSKTQVPGTHWESRCGEVSAGKGFCRGFKAELFPRLSWGN
jgi:hypothetical protein